VKNNDARIAELERTVARLRRDLKEANARNGNPKQKAAGAWVVKPDADIAKGSSGTCSVYAGEVDTTINVTAKALGAAVKSGKWCTAWVDPAGHWYVGCWE
jgi:type II secretory pathway component PulJ